MESIIAKIRQLSLRMWVIISLALMVSSFLILISGNNYSSLKLYITFGQLSTLILMTGLAAFAVKSLTKTKIILCIAVAGVALSMYGLFDTFSNPWIDYSSASINELVEYYVENTTAYQIVQTLAFTVAFAIGLNSIYKHFLLPWIIFMVDYALSFIIAYLGATHAIMGDDVVSFNMVIGILGLAGFIILIVKGGKKAASKEQMEVRTNTSLQQQEVSNSSSIISKSKELFQLKELLDGGILTDEEFETEKRKILDIK